MYRFIKIVVLTIFVALGFSAHAQINVNENGDIRSLINNYIHQGKSQASIDGWRIQIVTTDDRREMEQSREKFSSLYPSWNSDWEHRSPYYLVKVGAFRDPMAYQLFLLEIKEHFPSAIPIRAKLAKTAFIR